MDTLDGAWRLVDSRAWNVEADRLAPIPYGRDPIGHLVLASGRMLLAVWYLDVHPTRHDEVALHSLGGRYLFDGAILDCQIEVASDAKLIGERRLRDVVMLGDDDMLWRPPARLYASQLERRELVWQRVWRNERE